MRWLMIALGSVAGLVAVIAAIGAALPKHHVARRKARYAASSSVVFDAIRDVAAHPSWRKDVKSVELLPDVDGHRRFVEHGSHGKITFEVMEERANARLVVRITNDDLPFGGAWTYEIEDAGGGCVLTVTERGEVKNVIFRFMARFVFAHTKTLEDYLVALGKKLGETITPEELSVPAGSGAG